MLKRAVRAARSPLKSIEFVLQKMLVRPYLDRLSAQLRPGLTVIEELPIPLSYPIDIVYTWVDDQDPQFIDELNAHLPEGQRNRTTTSAARFRNHEELKYSLRSIEAYAPWVNKIYIVTNGQRPAWISDDPRISFVAHRDILDASYLPTFNSHVIGSALHKIAGLSEHYIYFNDDVLLLRPLEPTRGFTVSGKSYGYLTEVRIAAGAPLDYETATEWGAKNSRDLIQRNWGILDRRFAHMFHPQRKSVAEACETLFAAEYDAMRQNKFRQMNDLLCCGFLHHYAGYFMGETLFRTEAGQYIFVRSRDAKDQYAKLLGKRGSREASYVMCLNDYEPAGGGVADYERALTAFLDAYYPSASAFERVVA